VVVNTPGSSHHGNIGGNDGLRPLPENIEKFRRTTTENLRGPRREDGEDSRKEIHTKSQQIQWTYLKQWLLRDGTGGWLITCPTTLENLGTFDTATANSRNLAVTPSTARRKPKKNDTGAEAAKMDTGPPMMTHRRDDPGHTERFADDGQRTWRELQNISGVELRRQVEVHGGQPTDGCPRIPTTQRLI
jgi:hypothetical protein